jgi:hypothetical protein
MIVDGASCASRLIVVGPDCPGPFTRTLPSMVVVTSEKPLRPATPSSHA